jgi:hypothetical protein
MQGSVGTSCPTLLLIMYFINSRLSGIELYPTLVDLLILLSLFICYCFNGLMLDQWLLSAKTVQQFPELRGGP